MDETSIKLIKDSCHVSMGCSCVSCLLKFVAWSGLKGSFHLNLDKEPGEARTQVLFRSLLAVGQVCTWRFCCMLGFGEERERNYYAVFPPICSQREQVRE